MQKLLDLSAASSMANTLDMTDVNIAPGLQRAKLRYPDIDLDRCRLIGWGAGERFEKIYPQLGIELDYTVCIWDSNIGKTKCGIRVHAADRLRQEDPANVLIIVFSRFWFDCMRQLAAYGPFRVVRAYDEYQPGLDLQGKLRTFFDASPVPVPKGMDAASVGIMVQGPVLPNITSRVLFANRCKFPFAKLVLSTWNGTPPESIAECEPYVDEIVKSPVPSHPGTSNGVMQRDSTLAGLAVLARLGVRYAFKTRTDQSIVGDGDMNQLLELVRLPIWGNDSRRRERIAFCTTISWKFIPFHLTDQLQFGRLDDLLEFWNTRDDSILGTMVFESSLPANFLAMSMTESNITRCYLRRIGVPYALSLESYWQVVADRFVIMPEADYQIINWKAIPLFDIPAEIQASTPDGEIEVSPMNVWCHADWKQLIVDRASITPMGRAIDRVGLTVGDFYSCTPFVLPKVGRLAAEER